MQAGLGHVIEITSTGTYSFIGLDFSGFGGTGGSNLTPSSGPNDAAIYNNSGGAIIINVSGGGNSPSVRNAASSTTTVNNNVSVTFDGMRDNTEVRVYTAGTSTELDGVENATDGSTDDRSVTFSLSASTVVDIRFANNNWIVPDRNSILGFTWPTSDTTIPITQVIDRNFSNP